MLMEKQDQFGDFRLHFGPNPAHDPAHTVKLRIRDLDFWYGQKKALASISMDIHEREVTALIGPSGCGKTTLLRCLNRTNDPDLVRDAHSTGTILMDGQDIHDPGVEPPQLRRRFGWVAQRPNPFPTSIYRNIAYGPKIHGLVTTRAETDELVERCLIRVGLWAEVRDRLRQNGLGLSVGQQQRLCIARAIAASPEVLLMDEPASALDPVSTAIVENMINDLRDQFTIVIVTHNMQQAARIAQRVAMFHLGRLVEIDDTQEIFLRPREDITVAYITGRYG